jgi:hypothetical protein
LLVLTTVAALRVHSRTWSVTCAAAVGLVAGEQGAV